MYAGDTTHLQNVHLPRLFCALLYSFTDRDALPRSIQLLIKNNANVPCLTPPVSPGAQGGGREVDAILDAGGATRDGRQPRRRVRIAWTEGWPGGGGSVAGLVPSKHECPNFLFSVGVDRSCERSGCRIRKMASQTRLDPEWWRRPIIAILYTCPPLVCDLRDHTTGAVVGRYNFASFQAVPRVTRHPFHLAVCATVISAEQGCGVAVCAGGAGEGAGPSGAPSAADYRPASGPLPVGDRSCMYYINSVWCCGWYRTRCTFGKGMDLSLEPFFVLFLRVISQRVEAGIVHVDGATVVLGASALQAFHPADSLPSADARLPLIPRRDRRLGAIIFQHVFDFTLRVDARLGGTHPDRHVKHDHAISFFYRSSEKM